MFQLLVVALVQPGTAPLILPSVLVVQVNILTLPSLYP
jgi:hypothetical protein